jgi:hypothetical protein
MKSLKEFLLTELGTGTKPYSFYRRSSKTIGPEKFENSYLFDTANDMPDNPEDYSVGILVQSTSMYDGPEFFEMQVDFGTERTGFSATGGSVEVMFRVMSTVVAIIKADLKFHQTGHRYIHQITFSADGKSDKNKAAKQKLYMAYVKKAFGGKASVRMSSGITYITLPKGYKV